ncbi:MAG TPA: enoyl-CoA hydratase/isomerase family protein, partial [Rhizobiales bacterium]|nr:enoyl-CoA hydratase/isomerase family protein [Hyphomicrobiales bacterium]
MQDEILFEIVGRAGVITLNRPKALNAVTLNMVEQMAPQLSAWANDDRVGHVIIKAAPGRAFSAGGDIVQLYQWGMEKDPRFAGFYQQEYPLNIAIKRFPKPYIALIDGIVMGGGVGVSFHGSHRIVTENLTFAMPETGIGLFPDVGGTYFLPRCPGAIGMYLGLTGARVKAADAMYCKLATHYVPAENLGDLEVALYLSEDVDATINEYATQPDHAPLQDQKKLIGSHFRKVSVQAIFDSLAADDSKWAAQTLATLKQKSPTSLLITHRQLVSGVGLSFELAMRLEYRIVSRIVKGVDFLEGTRAVVIDKDMKPKWQPAT